LLEEVDTNAVRKEKLDTLRDDVPSVVRDKPLAARAARSSARGGIRGVCEGDRSAP